MTDLICLLLTHPQPTQQDDDDRRDYRPDAEANVAPDLSRIFIARDPTVAPP